MRIRSLRAVGWRNLAPLELALDPGVRLNAFFGDNGQGKTNLLEALYYLATFRSFRTTQAVDLVQRGAAAAQIGVDVETGSLQRTVDARLDTAVEGAPQGAARVRRTIRVDGKPVRAVAAAFGHLSVVLFVPEDLLLVRASPAARRRFVDLAVAGGHGAYFGEAAAFQKILRSRNALLRSGRSSRPGALLETYDEQLAAAGARIVERRRQLVLEIAPGVADSFRALHGDLAVTLRYVSDPAVAAAGSAGEITTALHVGLQQRRAVDERRGFTTFGPQTDDMEIDVDGRPARAHASQGQLRSLVLSLKLAELSRLESLRGEPPVLLLDDVPSELDPRRRRYLFEALARLSGQTLVSVADRGVIPALDSRVDFVVEAGRIARAPA